MLHESRLDARKRKEEMILMYTNELINLYLQLKDTAKSILRNESADNSCRVASQNFLRYVFDIAYFDAFKEDQKKCMDYMNNLQEIFMCDACDPEAKGF